MNDDSAVSVDAPQKGFIATLNDLMTKLLDFIARREKLYFRTIIVLIITALLLAAQKFQDLVVFVSLGLLIGALYYRRKGNLVDIGAFIGACYGFLLYSIYFVLSSVIRLL